MNAPTRQMLLKDFRKWSKQDNPEFQAQRLVSRWVRCGYDLAELPVLVTGLTAEIVAAGVADARR